MTTTLGSITASAPAKINLTLDVLGPTGDGFHELRSLVVGIDFRDSICCTLIDDPGVAINCNEEELVSEDNLAVRAAQKLATELGRAPALSIDLEKAIPVGGGLGGGSSDAATTLALCNRLWGGDFDPMQLAAIGAELGSDIPLFFSLPSAVISGRGQCVQSTVMRWSGYVLLVLTGAGVSTVRVYSAWRHDDSTPSAFDRVDAILASSEADQISRCLSNDLEAAVFRVSPQVSGIFDELNRRGFGPMSVSGAGSTLFRLFDEKEDAWRAARAIEDLDLGVSSLVVAAPVGSEL